MNATVAKIDFCNRYLRQFNYDGKSKIFVYNTTLIVLKNHFVNAKPLWQQIGKYLTSLYRKATPLPYAIAIVDLTNNSIYFFHSDSILFWVENIDANFEARYQNVPIAIWDLSDAKAIGEFQDALDKLNYTKVNISADNVVNWAKYYYKLVPNATRQDFWAEIRNPKVLAQFIKPYLADSNVAFEQVMDKIDNKLAQKNAGAFYTPPLYAQKALELVRRAIAQVPSGNDYIILDRCAGTGNLEKFMTDEELSHTILNTLNYDEWKILKEQFGAKVRYIVTPTIGESGRDNDNTNALSFTFVNNKVIKSYIDNPKCNIVIFENPPYAETTAIEWHKNKVAKESSKWKQSYLVNEFKKHLRQNHLRGNLSNEMANTFIWSAFYYYLHKVNDALILLAPIKYWKYQNLVNHKFNGGFGFNRKHFGASADLVSCIWWSPLKQAKPLASITIANFDIDIAKQNLIAIGETTVEKVAALYSEVYYDKRQPATLGGISGGLVCLSDGKAKTDKDKQQVRITAYDGDNIIAYLKVESFSFQNSGLTSLLTRGALYNGNGFYLYRDNYLTKLPLFAAALYSKYDNTWYKGLTKAKSGDGHSKYHKDVASGALETFLKRTLLFTTLSKYAKMRSLQVNSKLYRNELCLDNTNGTTLAIIALDNFAFDEFEQQMLDLWWQILSLAKESANYNPNFTYGPYQIEQELCDGNAHLKSKLNMLTEKVNAYYRKYILPTLVYYEFIK